MSADSGTSAAPRALVITSNFPPDASVGTMRTLRLVRHLAEMGWQIDVVTAAPEGFRPGTLVDAALLEKVPIDVRVLRARALRPVARVAAGIRPKGGLIRDPDQTYRTLAPNVVPGMRSASKSLSRFKRAASACLAIPDHEVSWFMPAVVRGWSAVRHRRPDVIYSSGPPFTAHLVGAALSRLADRPWVADFRDPWARAPWREDRFAFERRAWQLLERSVVMRAKAVIFATETNRQDFAHEYGPAVARRFHVVPNGCDVNEFRGLSRRASVAQKEKFVLLHAGSLYGARNPAPLLKAVARAIASGGLDPDRFRLRFVGRVGVPGIDLRALTRDLSIERVVEFVSHLPRLAVLQEMLDASALLVVQPVTTVSVPAKLYEYMAAGRPILALAEPGGETAELVRRTGAGVAVPAEDEPDIEQALLTMVGSAGDAFSPVDPRTYDGAVRAAEARKILADVASGANRNLSCNRKRAGDPRPRPQREASRP